MELLGKQYRHRFNMIIYNIGLPRTGTKSIAQIVRNYGFICKHPNITGGYNFEYNFLKKNISIWKADDRIYSNTPVWHPEFWKLLNIEEHKIIYTYRDKESWIKSIQNYNYFKNNKLLPRDEYWFRDYFKDFNTENLSDVYDRHLKAVNELKNVLKIDIIKEENIDITKKICKFLNIEFNEFMIIKNEDKIK